MPESITSTLPKGKLEVEQILLASNRISEWLESLERPFNIEKNELQLTRYDQNNKNYSYHYLDNRTMKDPKENETQGFGKTSARIFR